MAGEVSDFDALDGRDLRLVVELQRRGSINRAAEACGIGQPAATKRLQRMSVALGVEIVETEGGDGTAAKLTPEGAKVADHGRRVLKSLDRLQSELGA